MTSRDATESGTDLRAFSDPLPAMVAAAPAGPFLWGQVDDPAKFLADAAAATEAHGDSQPVAWAVQTTDPADPITVAYCGNGPRSHHTAALIAHLLNNAEALAALRAVPAEAEPGQRWAHLDDGSDPAGRAAAEKYVETVRPADALGAVPAEAEEAPESAWLIEQGQPEGYSPPIYYALDQPRTAHYPAWTKDPFKARMFERRELAVAFMDSMRDGDRPMPGRPVEHGFIEGPVRPADASGGGEGLDVAMGEVRRWHVGRDGGAAMSDSGPDLRAALAEDAALLHGFVHPDIAFDECDGARCVRRRAALAASEGAGLPAGLDAAWAAAEAALPEGWVITVWRTMSASVLGWGVEARFDRYTGPEDRDRRTEFAHGLTLAAALEALTRRLISPASDTEEQA